MSALATVFIALLIQPASAFDPFLIATGAKFLSLPGAVDDAADTGMAIGDLLVDLDVDPTAGEEAERIARKADSVRSIANEAEFYRQEVDSVLNFDSLKAKSQSQRVRHIQRMVQMLKKISALFGLRPKAAEKAAQIQQTQLSYMMLDELMAMRRAQLDAHLDSRRDEAERRVMLERLQKEEAAARDSIRLQHRTRRKP